MTLSISKEFSFSASHVLEGLPDNHKCTRLHGHSYRVRIELAGEVDQVGFIMDYGELVWVRDLIANRLDHRHLNDVLDVNPTAENIASWLAHETAVWLNGRPERERIRSLSVAVSETLSTWATSWLELTA